MVGLWKASLVINGTDYGPVASTYWYMAFERSATRLSLTRESYPVALLAGARLPKPPNYTNVYTGDNYALVDEGVDSLDSHCVTGTALTSTIRLPRYSKADQPGRVLSSESNVIEGQRNIPICRLALRASWLGIQR